MSMGRKQQDNGKIKAFNNLTLRQFILNEQEDNIHAVAGNTKLGLFSGIFGGLIKGLSTLAKQAIFPILMAFALVEEVQTFRRLRRSKNRTASAGFNMFLGSALFIAQAVAVLFALTTIITAPAIVPFLFTISSAISLFKSLAETIYHGIKWFQSRNEPYSKEYNYQKTKFFESLKGFTIGAIALTGVLAVFFLPVVAPAVLAVAVVPVIFSIIKIAVCALLGAFCAHGFGKMLYNKFKPDNSQEQDREQEEKGINPNEEKAALIDQSNSRKYSHEIKLDSKEAKHYRNSDKFNNLKENHIDDLLIKLELLEKDTRKEFLIQLINQEKEQITTGKNSLEKFQALNYLKKLIKGETVTIEDNGITHTIDDVIGLTTYYKEQEQLNDVFTSYFANHGVGGMQKLFVLVDHYLQLQKMQPDAAEMKPNDDEGYNLNDIRNNLGLLALEPVNIADPIEHFANQGVNFKSLWETASPLPPPPKDNRSSTYSSNNRVH